MVRAGFLLGSFLVVDAWMLRGCYIAVGVVVGIIALAEGSGIAILMVNSVIVGVIVGVVLMVLDVS